MCDHTIYIWVTISKLFKGQEREVKKNKEKADNMKTCKQGRRIMTENGTEKRKLIGCCNENIFLLNFLSQLVVDKY